MYIELYPVSYIDPGKHLTLADRRDVQREWEVSWKTQLELKQSEFLLDHLLGDLKEWGLNYRLQFRQDVEDWIRTQAAQIDTDAAVALVTRWREASAEVTQIQVVSYSVSILGPFFEEAPKPIQKRLVTSYGRFLRDSTLFFRHLHKAVAITEAWLRLYPDNGGWDTAYRERLTTLMGLNGAWTNTKRVAEVQETVGCGIPQVVPKHHSKGI